MTCLNLTNGFFIGGTWTTAPMTNLGQVTVTRTATSISIQHTAVTGSLNLNGDFLYHVFGDRNFVALLKRDSALNTITWTVSIVDISGGSIGATLLFSRSLPSSNSPPFVMTSPGNGRLAFFGSGTGTQNQIANLMIVRSDDGSPLLFTGGSISGVNNVPAAEITATDLIIHHPNTGPNDTTEGPRPQGVLAIMPGTQDFGEAVIGGSDPSLATVTDTVTLSNTGTDCLTISAIANDGPFSLAAASTALLPIELDPGESQTIEIVFAPTMTGNNIQGSMAVSVSPAQTVDTILCIGDARQAAAQISVSTSGINFGTIPHPGNATNSFNIINTGEIDVTVTMAGPPAGSAFGWTPLAAANLAVGASIPVAVSFTTPGDVAAMPQTITVTPSMGGNRTVTLNGAGCVANAVPVHPPTIPLNFGQIEAGFRSVRFIEIQNTGDGDLMFQARITATSGQAAADLFGLILPGADITDAPAMRDYTVLPMSRCGPGPTGDGSVIVAVSFFADAAPNAIYSAQLEVDDPLTGIPSIYPLTAEITPAVPVDAVLVLDKSGSMTDPVGQRTKIDAARSSGILFSQLLRDAAEDRAAVISFNDTPNTEFPMDLVAGNRTALDGVFGGIIAGGATNIAGGMITGEEQFTNPAHPSAPPNLKRAMIVLSDGRENRCFQRGGTGDWLSVTGRDALDGMAKPDGTPQDSEVLGIGSDIKVYGVGLGDPADIDVSALDALSTATGGHFGLVEDMTGSDFFLLEKYFTQIFMDAVDLAQIMDPFYSITPGEKHTHQFDIFPGDVNTMVVVYDDPKGRLPFVLMSPQGEPISPSFLPPGFGLRYRSTPTARFVEVTFPRGEPKRYAGRWTVTVLHEGRTCLGDINRREGEKARKDDTDGRSQPGFLPEKCRETKDPVRYGIAIGAGSNLRLQAFVEPGKKYVGDPIRLNGLLAEAGLPVTGASIKVEVISPTGTVRTVVLHDDGAHDDGAADDGDYGGTFLQTTEAGSYAFTFRASGLQGGRPYQREAYRTKYVFDPRNPNDGPGGGGGSDDCCDRLLKYLKSGGKLPEPAKEQPSKDKRG